MPRVQVFQHEAFEDLDGMGPWFTEQGWEIAYTRVDKGEDYPESLEGIDMLVLMGGTMGVYEREKYPWIDKELAIIKEAIDKGVIVLGVCLGAQLIAAALGAEVYQHDVREIGWHEIEKTEAGRFDPVFEGIPDKMLIFQWHGDTFDLPEGATLLATSNACPHQAFSYGQSVLALQFHPENTAPGLLEFLPSIRKEPKGPFVQTEDQIREFIEARCEQMNAHMHRILGNLTATVSA